MRFPSLLFLLLGTLQNQLKDKKRQLMEILRMSVEEADATGVANGNEAVARTTQRLNKEHSDAVSELKARHAAQVGCVVCSWLWQH